MPLVYLMNEHEDNGGITESSFGEKRESVGMI
jgi:hypothetical protein